jgi:hypothetical protein
VQAFISDAFVCVTLHEATHAERIALWMNSTLGLFLSELLRHGDHVQSITVRDAQEFPIPDHDVLRAIEPSLYNGLARRRVTTLDDEFGAVSYDSIRPETVLRDRRKLDAFIMGEVMGLSDEEQRWVYRFAFAWWSRASNIRHIANALAFDLERLHKIKPLRSWYWPKIDQLPLTHRREIVLEHPTTEVEAHPTMFGWQVRVVLSTGQEMVFDTASGEESELISLLLSIGTQALEIPADVELINEVLPLVRSFVESVRTHLDGMLGSFPHDIRKSIRLATAAVLSGR